jgi:alpha(1,3/1,4) fucosyltransferase
VNRCRNNFRKVNQANKPKLRVNFCNFWPAFSKTDNFFTEVLRTRYDVEVSDRPDFLIYTCYGDKHRRYTCPRIFYSGESGLPDWRECDYALTSHYLNDPRHLRLPLYVLYAHFEELRDRTPYNLQTINSTPESVEQVLARKTKFCAFVASNTKMDTKMRIEFFHRLSRYKRVDSGGQALNNIGRPIPSGLTSKQDFLHPYKFNLCFENTSVLGYTTEKIYEAMLARCIPIYWGSRWIQEEFNPKSFLNYFDFPNEEALVERIMEIDNNDDLYLEYLRQPYFHHNRPNEYFDTGRLLDFFDKVLTTKISPVGARWRIFQPHRWFGA